MLIPYLAIKVQSKSLKKIGLFKQATNNIPVFLYGFIFFIFIRTIGDQIMTSSLIWEQILSWNHQLVSALFGFALIALGLSIKIKELKDLSSSSIVIGLIFSLGVLFVGIIVIPIIG